MKNIKLVLTFLFLFSILFSQKTLAAVRCESQYGGGEICIRTGELQINKKVLNPEDNNWVDNLGAKDYHFAPGEIVKFKLEIKNVGDEKLKNINVRDLLPTYLNHYSGNLDFQIEYLLAGESVEKELEAKIALSENFPNNNSLICVINSAEAWSENEKDKDTSQICIEKKVLGITTFPDTGDSLGFFYLAFFIVFGISGLIILNKAKEKKLKN
jgi:uncharacterized repeat protein (TIGR01451 family)